MEKNTKSIKDYLKKNSFYDENAKKIKIQYFYKYKKCKLVPLTGKLESKCIGYYLILEDLYDVRNWIEELYDKYPRQNKTMIIHPPDADNSIIKALFVSSVTYYGKCFTSAKGRKIKLESNVFEGEYLNAHDRIMRLRHNLTAHAGENGIEGGDLIFILPPKEKSNLDPYLSPEIIRPEIVDDRNKEVPFLKLVKYLIELVEEKITVIRDKIYQTVISKHSKSEWYKIASK